MVDGVADHVGERVSQQLDHRLVDFRRFAFGAQPDVLGRGIGHFANDARHALEQRAHRLGADAGPVWREDIRV